MPNFKTGLWLLTPTNGFVTEKSARSEFRGEATVMLTTMSSAKAVRRRTKASTKRRLRGDRVVSRLPYHGRAVSVMFAVVTPIGVD